jgi:hypothetical protein
MLLLFYVFEGHIGDKFAFESKWGNILRSWLAGQPKKWLPDHQYPPFHLSLFPPSSFLFPKVPKNLKERFGLSSKADHCPLGPANRLSLPCSI